MSRIKYFFQFLVIIFLFSIFKLLGIKYSSIISGKLLTIIGPLFRSQKICYDNLSIALPKFSNHDKRAILKKMWFNYGRILAEYMFIDKFRNSKLSQNVVFVPESASVDKALSLLLKEHCQLTVVVDEFGSVAGVLALEDIIESILGQEIFEHDDIAVDMRELAKKRHELKSSK